MLKLSIRTTAAGDAGDIAALVRQMGYSREQIDISHCLNQINAHNDHHVYVAVDVDDRVIGWAHVFISLRLGATPFAEIGGMVVDQEKRRQGVGGALVTACTHWAHERGARRLRVRCNAHRESAHEFYQRTGFEFDKQQHVYDLAI